MATINPTDILGCGQAAGSVGDKFAQAAEQFVRQRTEFFDKEKKFFGKDGSTSKPGGLFSGGGGGQNFLSEIMSFASGMGDFDLKAIMQGYLGNKFGIDIGGGAFESLQGIFKTLGTMLMSMHMTNTSTLWNFVDYSRREVVQRIGRAITELDGIRAQVDLMLARYDTLSPEGVAHWMANYTSLIEEAIDALEGAHDELGLLEFGMRERSIFNPVHQQAALSYFEAASRALRDEDGAAGEIIFLCRAKVDLDGLADKFQHVMGTLEATKNNYVGMPAAIDGINVKAMFGITTVETARGAAQSLQAEMRLALERTQASTSLTYSAANWAIYVDGMASMIKNLEQDREIEKDGPQMEAAEELAAEFSAADLSTYTGVINDIRIFGDLISTLVKEGRISSITNFRVRLLSQMDALRATLVALQAAVQAKVPPELDPEAGKFINEARESNFDNWIHLLFTGDILGFLQMNFGNASSGGNLVSTIVEMIKCLPSTTNSQPIMKFYDLGKADMEKAENSARIRNFEPFKQHRKDLDTLERVYKNLGERAKTEGRKSTGR